jgi:hypothetical protein
MSHADPVSAVAFDRLSEVITDIEGVYVRRLTPFTTLLIQTTNSLYRVVIAEGPAVYVQGGAFFPETTRAYLDGASIGGSSIRMGWIGVGFLVEFRRGGRRVVTSPVRAITTLITSAAATLSRAHPSVPSSPRTRGKNCRQSAWAAEDGLAPRAAT